MASLNDVKLLKEFYEGNIKTILCEALSAKEDAISVEWAVESTTIMVDLTAGDNVNKYTFIYTPEDLGIAVESYKVLFNEVDGNRYINGVQAKEAKMDLRTLTAIHQIIGNELNKEYVEPVAEEKVGSTEEVAAVEE